MESKTDNRENFNMNISNYLSFFFSDKWSVGGALGCVMGFYTQFLMSFEVLNKSIGTATALIGLCVAILSFYKLSIQVAKEKREYEKMTSLKPRESIEVNDNEL